MQPICPDGYPPTAISYPPTTVDYPLIAAGYLPTAVVYPPTAVGYTFFNLKKILLSWSKMQQRRPPLCFLTNGGCSHPHTLPGKGCRRRQRQKNAPIRSLNQRARVPQVVKAYEANLDILRFGVHTHGVPYLLPFHKF